MSKKLTTEEFIIKAKTVHGDKYNYSKVIYINSKTKITIICPKHGIYEQSPNSHLRCGGCPKCGKIKTAESLKLNTKDFIKHAIEIHGNKYDYSNVNYINNRTKIIIVCPEHGQFKQTPNGHLDNKGCSKCYGNKKSTTKEFILKVKKIHGNKYNYSKVNYVNTNIKVIIICPVHGEFNQQAYIHLSGCGCPKCCGKNKTTEDFIKRAVEIHDNEYDYSKLRYINAITKVKIICHKHGVFEQTPNSHLNGNGCPSCYCNKKLTTKEFIENAKEIHGIKYDYSKVNYINIDTKVIIICHEHGEFKQKPNGHLKGNGCPLCAGNVKWLDRNLMPFNEIKKLVRSNNIKSQREYNEWWKENKDFCQKNGIPSQPQNIYN